MSAVDVGELIEPFQQRFPWWGPDLQTVRDTLLPQRLAPRLPQQQAERILIDVGGGDRLLGWLELPDPPERPGRAAPTGAAEPRALVLLLPGLGGCSDGVGPRRLALALRQAGLAVLRLNLRGAGAGRSLARGSSAAQCTRDLRPVLQRARHLAQGRPLFGVGLSLGGTMLLNAVLEDGGLEALVCLSSPLDLAASILQIERPRNRLYQRWLVRRLRRQILADPFGVPELERRALTGPGRPRSIRRFDALITAPRWGYDSVEQYYAEASPLPRLLAPAVQRPPLLIVHAQDDPWVPVGAAQRLVALGGLSHAGSSPGGMEVCLTPRGGHNGFHGCGDTAGASWSDRLTVRWLLGHA